MGTAGSDAAGDKSRKAATGAPPAWIEETLNSISDGKTSPAKAAEKTAGAGARPALEVEGTTKNEDLWISVNREGKGDRLNAKGDRLDIGKKGDRLTNDVAPPSVAPPEVKGMRTDKSVSEPVGKKPNETIIVKSEKPLPEGGMTIINRIGDEQTSKVPKTSDKVTIQKPGSQPSSSADALKYRSDGSASYAVQSGDGLAKIARLAYKEAYPKSNPDKLTWKQVEEISQKLIDANKAVFPDISMTKVNAGWSLVIPNDVIYRKEATDRIQILQKPGHDDYKAITVAGASQEWVKEVVAAWDSQPAELRKRLADANLKLVIAGDMRDYDPAFALQQPFGYPPGTSFLNIDGIHTEGPSGEAGSIAILERSLDTNGKFVSQKRFRYATVHECAHAFDSVLGNYSRGTEFTPQYEQDIAKLTADERKKFAYYIQGYDPASTSNIANGRKELFADTVSAIFGTSPKDVKEEQEELRQKFPRSFNAVLDKLLAEKIIDDATKKKFYVTIKPDAPPAMNKPNAAERPPTGKVQGP